MYTAGDEEEMIVSTAPKQEEAKFKWDWSREALGAFVRVAQLPRIKRLGTALSAALEVEAPLLFKAQLDGMVTVLTTHPILGKRVLKLKNADGAEINLTIDRELIEYILYDTLPAVKEDNNAEEEETKA